MIRRGDAPGTKALVWLQRNRTGQIVAYNKV